MSRTDKTAPYWVQIARREGNIKPWRIYHVEHCDGTCTPGTPLPGRPRFTQCEIWMRYSDNYLFYGRRPKRSTRIAAGTARIWCGCGGCGCGRTAKISTVCKEPRSITGTCTTCGIGIEGLWWS